MAGFSKKLINLNQLKCLTPFISKYANDVIIKTNICLLSQSKISPIQNFAFSTDIPPATRVVQVTTENEKREFLSVFPDIIQNLTNLGTQTDISDAQKWFAKVLQYNVIGGKMTRGLAVYSALKEFLPIDQFSSELKRKAHVLGWVLEILQAHYLVADDIMDGGKLRRGKPCWYQKEGVGLGAVNDSLLLNAGVYKILSLHFRDEPYYVDMLELFHDMTLKTSLGLSLDMLTCPLDKRPDFTKFTMDHYSAIARYKTSYYSYYLPTALAMFMAGIRETDFTRVANITDRELHRQARTILLEIGSFFQVQDDYIDCFGDPKETGKVGTDIAEGKCTWLAVVALQRATSSQRKIFEEHYGRSEEESVEKVKKLYTDLNIPATFRAYEDSTSSLVRTHIQQISRGLNHNVFFKLLDNIYQRSS